MKKRIKPESRLQNQGIVKDEQNPPVKPEKDIPTKPNPNPDPTRPKPGQEPEKVDPTRIEEPQKTDPTRIDEPVPPKQPSPGQKNYGRGL